MSQTKTVMNKKKKNQNISSYQLDVLDMMNIKKNFAKGFNANNFSKILNVSNATSKNAFSKTLGKNFSNVIYLLFLLDYFEI